MLINGSSCVPVPLLGTRCRSTTGLGPLPGQILSSLPRALWVVRLHPPGSAPLNALQPRIAVSPTSSAQNALRRLSMLRM